MGDGALGLPAARSCPRARPRGQGDEVQDDREPDPTPRVGEGDVSGERSGWYPRSSCAYPAAIGTGGETGRVVKDLVALRQVKDAPAWRKARTQALARRIARAERWAAWGERTPS